MLLRYKLFFQIAIFIMTSNFALSEVTISIGNVNVDGYTEDIVVPVTVSNPNEAVGGFQFDIVATPAIINLSGISAVNDDSFSVDFNVLDDGSARVVFYSNTGEGIPLGTDEVVMNLHYSGMDVLSALVDLEAFDFGDEAFALFAFEAAVAAFEVVKSEIAGMAVFEHDTADAFHVLGVAIAELFVESDIEPFLGVFHAGRFFWLIITLGQGGLAVLGVHLISVHPLLHREIKHSLITTCGFR